MRFSLGDMVAAIWIASCGFGGWHIRDTFYAAFMTVLLFVLAVAYIWVLTRFGISSLLNPTRPRRLVHDVIVFVSPVVFDLSVLMKHNFWFNVLPGH